MGAANVIPGVSGGTIAFITGIYEQLINALKHFDLRALVYLKKFDLAGFAKHIDLPFLVPLLLGVLTSVLTLAKVLKYAFALHPVLVGAFFFGLILASIYSVARMVKHWGAGQMTAVLLGLGVAVSLAFLSPASENSNPAYLGLCGVAGMSSMIIPGISGSFILLLMGNYQLIMLEAVNDLRQMNFADSLPVLIPVGIGAVIGLAALSHILGWLFKKYHDTAVALIAGFVAGSLVIIWPWKSPVYSPDIAEKVIAWDRYAPSFQDSNTWIALGLAAAGVAIIAVMEKLSVR